MILAGGKLSRTFRNLSRLRQITHVFAKYGFQEFLGKSSLIKRVSLAGARPKHQSQATPPPVRLRQALEELGPTFVKLGQVLSTRSDLLPAQFVSELVKLQDQVAELPFETVQAVIEQELGAPLKEIFSSFDTKSLASASIGQVHAATLLDGTSVVVKIQRPGIESLIKTDVAILRTLAKAVERYSPETRVLAPVIFVEEFFLAMQMELDFVLEANNCIKSRSNLKRIPQVYIPEVYLSLSSRRVLVIERLRGLKIDQVATLRDAGHDTKNLAQIIAKTFLGTVLEDGFFHGDLHGGNLFVLAGKNNTTQLAMIDFGVMGYLSPQARESLLRIFVALAGEDFESLCFEYAEIGTVCGTMDFPEFQRNLRATIAPYLGIPLSKLNVGKVLMDATSVAAKHGIRMPREWMIVFKAIYTLEGTCRKLDPDFNAIPFLESYLEPLVKANVNWADLGRDAALHSRDIQAIAQRLPRQVNWFLKRLANNNYAFEVKDAGAEKTRNQNAANVRSLVLGLYASTLLACSAFLFSLPGAVGLAAVGCVISLLFFWQALRN